jgi:peroxiredoxin
MKKYLLIAVITFFYLHVLAQTGLKIGTKAPEFQGIDNTGKALTLKTLLKSHKAVVLFFYRGQWCPYCNKQLKGLQDSLQLLTSKGAYVVGIRPGSLLKASLIINSKK